MTPLAAPTAAPLDPTAIRATVEQLLHDFLDQQDRTTTDLPELSLFTSLLRELLSAGGKRMRPVLCVIGWYTITGEEPPPAVWRSAASLELFHAFALIHDDIMDNSATRRGKPTAHRALGAAHPGHTAADVLGVNAAILLGDLALGWSDELLHSPEVTPAQTALIWPQLNALRKETLVGQYLDLVTTGQVPTDPATAWRIIRYKTAKYTVERPLHLGATLAGASAVQLETLSRYARPLGEAFQLRDDLLGVFGDPRQTGKSALEDLREGKQTVLVALAGETATVPQQRTLRTHLGNPHLTEPDADQVREVLHTTGARRAVEQMISDRHRQALHALGTQHLRPDAVHALRRLAARTQNRAA